MKELYSSNYAQYVAKLDGYAGFRNKLRIEKFTKLVSPLRADSLLEIGPNTGLLMDHWQKLGFRSVGIDINPAVINGGKLEIIKMDAAKIDFPDNSFDKIVAFEVLEHINNLRGVFAGAEKILKPKGTFHITFPFEFFRGQTALLDAWHSGGGLRLAREIHVHKLTPAKIKKIIKDTPFKIKTSKIAFIPWPSFYMVLEKVL